MLGRCLAAGGVALFVALGELWPWPITPLLARVVAGWYLLFGSGLLTAAVSMRRYFEPRR